MLMNSQVQEESSLVSERSNFFVCFIPIMLDYII